MLRLMSAFISLRVRSLSMALALTAALTASCTQAANGDYLTPDLRARVEKLKADAAYLPTDSVSQAGRANILWQWANAYALNGGVLPVNLTQAIAALSAYPGLSRPAVLDDFIFEMRLLDEQPDAIGSLRSDLGPFEAGSFATIRQTYTVGNRQIQTGGGFLVARHFMPNFGLWQTRNPGADNYVSIVSSNVRVSFAADSAPMSGMHGGFRGQAPTLVFRVATGTLEPGDTVTITYGDTSAGGRGLKMPTFSSDRMPLPLYLAFNEDEPFLTLPIQPIQVAGTSIARIQGFAPSVVGTGEPFALSLRAEDAYRNRALGGHPGLVLKRNGEVFRRVPASAAPITVLSDLALNEPGVYRLEIESADGRLNGSINPILVEDAPRRRVYWGDTHGHSGFAEGVGTAERFMRWARDDARLDYVMHSEHDIWLDDHEWEVLRENVTSYTAEGEFVAYLGYEWTVRNLQGGHHNVFFRTAEGRNRVPAQFFPTLSRLYQGLRESAASRDVIIIPHAHQAGDYRQNDPELEPLIEIMSQHGNFEWFGRMYLNHGHQVGFTAASDNHLSQPGYTMPLGGSLAQRGGLGAVLADNKTTDELFDAMKALRVYATTGDRIILDVSINGVGMGERADFALERKLEGRVIGTAAIESVAVVKNDEIVWQRDYLSPETDKLADEETLLLSFASDSTPYHPGDNPRGWRHWRGTLTVANGTIESVRGLDFHNALSHQLSPDPDADNTYRFATLTRGDTSSIELRLSGVKRTTAISLALEPAKETGGAPPLYRQPQEIAGGEVTLALRDLDDGRLTTKLANAGYEDTVTLRRVVSDGPAEVTFEYTDTDERQGDYYFVRIRQVDDALAWSSPIWIGGYRKR